MSDRSAANDEAGNEDSGNEGALQAAVWLAGRLGIAMPPVPGPLAERLTERVADRLFATQAVLAELQGPADIAAHVRTAGWPPSGLALGYVGGAAGGRWFYTLAGARLVLNVSLTLRGEPGGDGLFGTGTIGFAHAMLERYLDRAANYAAATSTGDVDPQAQRRIVAYSDEGRFEAAEQQAVWSEASSLGAFAPGGGVFADAVEELPTMERIIWL